MKSISCFKILVHFQRFHQLKFLEIDHANYARFSLPPLLQPLRGPYSVFLFKKIRSISLRTLFFLMAKHGIILTDLRSIS